MLKATMHKDNGPILGQYYIRSPRKTFVIHTIAESLVPKGVSQIKLRASILGSIMRHTFETLFWRHYI